jgi:hypothetical protein
MTFIIHAETACKKKTAHVAVETQLIDSRARSSSPHATGREAQTRRHLPVLRRRLRSQTAHADALSKPQGHTAYLLPAKTYDYYQHSTPSTEVFKELTCR